MSDRRQVASIIGELRANVEKLSAVIPENLRDVLLIYWSGGLCKVLAKGYEQALGRDLAKLKPLSTPIGVRADMTLEPSI